MTQAAYGWVKGEPLRYIAGHYSRPSAEERFWGQVAKGDGCWEWTGTDRGRGYGRIYANGRTIGTHRFSYELHHGPIPAGMFVCHSCDNPRCVRPDHLFLGAPAENSADMVAKGRQNSPVGERHGGSKLKAEDVRQIRRLVDERAVTQREIGERFGVSQSLVAQIAARKVWAWL